MTVHAGADVVGGGMRIFAEERDRFHIEMHGGGAALRNLLVDPGLLERMKLAVLSEPFDGRDVFPDSGRNRGDAGANRFTIEMHGGDAALGETAAARGASQLEIVAQSPKQLDGLV
jgi:hypothetical protein